MKGRAYSLWNRIVGTQRSSARSCFTLAQLILRTQVLPEEITADLDDPALEARLEEILRERRG